MVALRRPAAGSGTFYSVAGKGLGPFPFIRPAAGSRAFYSVAGKGLGPFLFIRPARIDDDHVA